MFHLKAYASTSSDLTLHIFSLFNLVHWKAVKVQYQLKQLHYYSVNQPQYGQRHSAIAEHTVETSVDAIAVGLPSAWWGLRHQINSASD